MTVWFVVGTSAELIKVVPIVHECETRGWIWKVLVTGQSGKNFWQQYDDFKLPRENTISLLKTEIDLDRAVSALWWMLKVLCLSWRNWRQAISVGRPDMVVVHGDTLSCLLGAWQARAMGLLVMHVEAGLRSPKLLQPFPEEITRRLVSQMANFHMAPDLTAVENLNRSGVGGRIVHTQGNTLSDAVLLATKAASPNRQVFDGVVNIHRFENLNSDQRWKVIVDSLIKAAKKWKLAMVLHPQTRHKLEQDDVSREHLMASGIKFFERLPFSQFLALVHEAKFLITDGGSNQEECSYLGKPCLLLREATERTEGMGSTTILSKFQPEVISDFLDHPEKFSRPEAFPPVRPSAVIADFILDQISVPGAAD